MFFRFVSLHRVRVLPVAHCRSGFRSGAVRKWQRSCSWLKGEEWKPRGWSHLNSLTEQTLTLMSLLCVLMCLHDVCVLSLGLFSQSLLILWSCFDKEALYSFGEATQTHNWYIYSINEVFFIKFFTSKSHWGCILMYSGVQIQNSQTMRQHWDTAD